MISILLLILAIDAFRTLFESVYFGAWYTALAGYLPKSIHTFLIRPEMVFIPKILNVIAAGAVIILLLFKWLPREEKEKGVLKQRIQIAKEELSQSNKLLSQNIEILNEAQKIAHIGHFDYDILKDELYWSPEIYRIFNKNEDSFKPTFNGYFASVHSDDHDFAKKEYYKSVQNNNSFDFEVRIVLDDKTIKYIQNKGQTEYDKDGKPIRTVGMILDVTDRVDIENAVQKSEFRHNMMLANIGDVIVIIDDKGVNRYKSPNIEKLFGWKPEDLIGESTWNNIHPDDVKSAQEFFNTLLDEPGEPGKTECRYRCKDEKYKWIEFTGVNLFHDPDILGILGNYHDITERKLTEQSLRESETRFKALHNASFGGIVIHDKGVILECNEGLSEMTGYSESELIGMDGLLLIAEESRQLVMDNIVSGYELPYEAEGLRKNGEIFPMRLEARNIPYKGKSVRTVEFRDITDQKLADAEREQLQSKLIQAQKMESVGRLAGGVAHDFNNMLSIIIGNSEIVLEDIEPNTPLIQNVTEIQKAAQRSSDLTRQLLAFARKQTISPRILDLNVTIEGMLKMLRRLIGEDIDLSWQPRNGLWRTRIDPSQVDQILANLCVNARDAIQNVGKITIETDNIHLEDSYLLQNPDFKPGDYVVLQVSDNGCGMDKETVANLFDPFFTTKDVGEGTGLGMATVYGIVRQNGGFINVYSEIGSGTTFKVYLPRQDLKQVDFVQKVSEKKILKGYETILLVEDEKAILDTTKMMLERLGYTVLTALSADEALELANEFVPDGIHLLMTDVVMPKMNGRDLSQELIKSYPNLKCLFMSGYTANVIAHHGILDEGLNFINKPYTKQDLSIKLRDILTG